MMTRKSAGRRRHEGFTLAEIIIGMSVAIVVGLAVYTLGSATLKLYAENFSLNQSHLSARLPLERIMREVQESGCPPKLVDENGADLPDNDIGPAAGIRFCVPANASNYFFASDAAAASTTVSLAVRPDVDPAKPRISDLLVIHAGAGVQSGNPVQVEITNVSGASSPYTLTLKGALGVAVKGNPDPDSNPKPDPALIVQQGAFVVQAGELRYYNTAINGTNSVRALAQVEPGSIPFSYDKDSNRATNDPGDPRLLRVNLRVRSGKYSNRVSSFNSFLNMKSSVAVRSTYLESNNTVRSAYLDCARFNTIQ